MTPPTHVTRRWLLVFVLLALGGVSVLVVALWPTRPGTATAPASATATVTPRASATLLDVAPQVGARLTLAVGGDTIDVADVDGASLLRRGAGTGDAFDVRLDPAAAAGTVLLSPARRWHVDLGGEYAHLRLALDALTLDGLRVARPVHAAEGALPSAGRSQLVLGAGRSTLLAPVAADLDLHLSLGAGPLLLRIEPEAVGDVVLVAGSGPATLIVDAAGSVALTLPSGEAPPLALEGTWWRHRDGDSVTWVRSPVAAEPSRADVRVTVASHLGAPLAITYR